MHSQLIVVHRLMVLLYATGNLLENTKFGPLYPNASECIVIVHMFNVCFVVVV